MSRIKCCLCAGVALGGLMGGGVWAEGQSKSGTSNSKAGVAAYIGTTVITKHDVDAKALATNMKLAQSLYDARLQALDRIIMERLLAKEAAERGISVDALIQERVAQNTKPVTDQDVQTFYNANRTRMRGRTLEQTTAQIRSYLTTKHANEAKQRLLKELKEKADVRIMLEPPRVDVVIAPNDPVQGPREAKVTIVEYADFQ